MTIVIAHRGADTKHENTVRAVKKAIAKGIAWVEVDVRMTKDKVPVVIHDDKVDRVTKGKGLVKDMTLEQLKKLKVGKEKIPTLQEVLDTAKGKCKLLIELKTADSLVPVCRMIRLNKMKKDVMIMSFAHPLVKYSKLFTRTKTAAPIVALHIKPMKILRQTKASTLMVYYETVLAADHIFKKLAKKMHKKKKNLFVYPVDNHTVFTKEQVQTFVNVGVDGIVANEPAQTKKIVEDVKWTAFSARL